MRNCATHIVRSAQQCCPSVSLRHVIWNTSALPNDSLRQSLLLHFNSVLCLLQSDHVISHQSPSPSPSRAQRSHRSFFLHFSCTMPAFPRWCLQCPVCGSRSQSVTESSGWYLGWSRVCEAAVARCCHDVVLPVPLHSDNARGTWTVGSLLFVHLAHHRCDRFLPVSDERPVRVALATVGTSSRLPPREFGRHWYLYIFISLYIYIFIYLIDNSDDDWAWKCCGAAKDDNSNE
jgi:hypothetical protein